MDCLGKWIPAIKIEISTTCTHPSGGLDLCFRWFFYGFDPMGWKSPVKSPPFGSEEFRNLKFRLHFTLLANSSSLPWGSMGLVYLPTWMVDFYGFHVGKYILYIDPMALESKKTPSTLLRSLWRASLLWIPVLEKVPQLRGFPTQEISNRTYRTDP